MNFSCLTFWPQNAVIPAYQNVLIIFVNNAYRLGNLEQFDTGRLDIVQNLCEFCPFFLTNFLGC